MHGGHSVIGGRGGGGKGGGRGTGDLGGGTVDAVGGCRELR